MCGGGPRPSPGDAVRARGLTVTLEAWFHQVMAKALRRLAVLLSLLLLAMPAESQDARPRHVLLWQVVSGGSTVYLLGSVHVAKPDIYPLNEYIEQAFSRSARLVVEIDIRSIDPGEMQRKILSLGVLPEGRTLRSELDPDDAALLDEKLSALGLPPGSFDRFRPWIVATILAETELAALGYAAENGVDLYFLKKAQDREVVELESADYQLGLLAGFSDEDQREMLKEYLGGASTAGETTAELLEVWLAGDEAGMEGILKEELDTGQAGGRISQALLRDRDAAMTKKIEQLLGRPGSSFVVVGAAHLLRKGGIRDRLAADGFEVIEAGKTDAVGAGSPAYLP
jgi:uncharacterized protein YbaP (TraB family)